MKKGRHHVAGQVKRGRDLELGIRFEARLKKRHARRKLAKAGRQASRKGRR